MSATAVLILYVCSLAGTNCHYVAGQHTLLSECLAMSRATAAAFGNLYPNLKLAGINCVDPKDLHKFVGQPI